MKKRFMVLNFWQWYSMMYIFILDLKENKESYYQIRPPDPYYDSKALRKFGLSYKNYVSSGMFKENEMNEIGKAVVEFFKSIGIDVDKYAKIFEQHVIKTMSVEWDHSYCFEEYMRISDQWLQHIFERQMLIVLDVYDFVKDREAADREKELLMRMLNSRRETLDYNTGEVKEVLDYKGQFQKVKQDFTNLVDEFKNKKINKAQYLEKYCEILRSYIRIFDNRIDKMEIYMLDDLYIPKE